MSCGSNFLAYLRNPIARETLDRTKWICSSQDRCLSICTPRYLTLSTISTSEPTIEKEGGSTSFVEIFLRLGRDPITIACVFRTFRDSLLPWSHFRKESSSLFIVKFRSLTFLAVKEMLVSSAYMVTWHLSRQNRRSLI